MKLAATIFLLLISTCTAFAADTKTDPAPQSADRLVQSTEQGTYMVEMAVRGKELRNGPNSLEMTVRDRAGKEVEGAQIVITPWMPTMGHGVWDKPVVTERGNGKYQVENVVIIMSGLWALKTSVRKGEATDLVNFTYYVAEPANAAPKEAEKPADGYERTIKTYNVPNVTLLNQDGKKVNLRALTDAGKPVIIDFIFTTCTTICPVLSAGFSSLRTQLGNDADKVQLISISIDPEHDRPEQMKEYLSRFNSGDGWDFLTGSRDDIGKVLKAFDAFIVDKMSHEPLYILRGPRSDDWVRIKGLIRKSDILRELKKVENK